MDARWFADAMERSPAPRANELSIGTLVEHTQSPKPYKQVLAPSLIIPALETARMAQYEQSILPSILTLLTHENAEVVEGCLNTMNDVLRSIEFHGFLVNPSRGTLIHTVLNLCRHPSDTVKLRLLTFLQAFLQWPFVTPAEKEFALQRVLDSISLEDKDETFRLEMLKFVIATVDNIQAPDAEPLLAIVTSLCEDTMWSVRRCIPNALTKLALVAPDDPATRESVLTSYTRLAHDEIWGVKKSCAEVLGLLAKCVTDSDRHNFITGLFKHLVTDACPYVRSAAYASLGLVVASYVETPPSDGLECLDVLYQTPTMLAVGARHPTTAANTSTTTTTATTTTTTTATAAHTEASPLQSQSLQPSANDKNTAGSEDADDKNDASLDADGADTVATTAPMPKTNSSSDGIAPDQDTPAKRIEDDEGHSQREAATTQPQNEDQKATSVATGTTPTSTKPSPSPSMLHSSTGSPTVAAKTVAPTPTTPSTTGPDSSSATPHEATNKSTDMRTHETKKEPALIEPTAKSGTEPKPVFSSHNPSSSYSSSSSSSSSASLGLSMPHSRASSPPRYADDHRSGDAKDNHHAGDGSSDGDQRPAAKQKLSQMMSASHQMTVDGDQGQKPSLTPEEADIIDGLPAYQGLSLPAAEKVRRGEEDDVLSPAVAEFKEEQAKAHELVRRREMNLIRDSQAIPTRPRTDASKPLQVPQILLSYYVTMATEASDDDQDVCQDALNFCAYNFPAVAWAVGAAHFDEIKDAFLKMAGSQDWTVRSTIASGLHEVARIVGTPVTDDVIVPIVSAFLSDWPQVRAALIPHLSTLFAVMSPSRRAQCCCDLVLLKYDDIRKWRTRSILAEQLAQLTYLFDVSLIKQHIVPLFLPLLTDRTACVREAATKMAAEIALRLATVGSAEGEAVSFVSECKRKLLASKSFALFQAKLGLASLFQHVSTKCANYPAVYQPLLGDFIALLSSPVANIRLLAADALNTLASQGVIAAWEKGTTTEKVASKVAAALEKEQDQDIKASLGQLSGCKEFHSVLGADASDEVVAPIRVTSSSAHESGDQQVQSGQRSRDKGDHPLKHESSA